MNNIRKTFIGLLVVILTATSCNDLLNVDNPRGITTDENQLDNPNDTIYSMLGILNELEKLGERYVLLGELRGDLMDITSDASADIKEIYDFNISESNKYNVESDYYTVINNCNYLINTVDTAIIAQAEKVMYKQFAAAKGIRAWTYLQACINYGSVYYYDDAILTIEDAKTDYPEIGLDELVSYLIEDLEPWQDIELPGSVSLGSDISTIKSYFPIKMLLGDLYLWSGQYEAAAKSYYDLIEAETKLMTYNRAVWVLSDGEFYTSDYWSSKFTYSNTVDRITILAGNTEDGTGNNLDSISWYYPEIMPSAIAIDNWESQTYTYNALTTRSGGDLRGEGASYIDLENLSSSSLSGNWDNASNGLIYKYMYSSSAEITRIVTVYNVGLLYLRYAEALNRAEKPNLAFAILKNGLNQSILDVDSIIPRHEKYSIYTDSTGTLYDYVDFTEYGSTTNTPGMHGRGSGATQYDVDYVIPALASLEDSMDYVEDMIVDELALESAFEGNRFQDLMRIALRRNDPSYLAEKVNAKYDGQAPVDLTNEQNWYLK